MQKNNTALTKEEIKRYTILFWKIVIGTVAFGAIFILSIGLGLFGPLPSFRDIEHPQSNLASAIIAADSVELGGYFVQNRSSIRYDQISPNVIHALVSAEDRRFYSHSGIDFKRNFTILFYIITGRWQGASTITQQLALNLFSREGRSHNTIKRVIQKLQEWIVAVRLEREYTKEEIITMYLNTVDWGAYNVYGIKSAASTYFSTTPDKLTPDQAAVLIAMLRAPSANSPVRNPENSLSRRNLILNQMADLNYIDEAEAETLKKTPLGIKFNPSSHNEGLAAYFREVLKNDVRNVLKGLPPKSEGSPYDIYRDGLKIYTTINSRMQRYAEDSQREYLKQLQGQFNAERRGRGDAFKGLENLLTSGMRNSDRYLQGKDDGKSESQIREEFNTPVKMTIFTWRGDVDTTMRPIDSIRYYKLMVRNSLMSMEPESGYVRAWVGGVNFEHFKYDQVKQGSRQVGSTAKPFTYAVAMSSGGYSPCYRVPNEPVVFEDFHDASGNPWSPRSDHTIPGNITLREALAASQNWVTAYMMKQVGATAVSTLAKKMGITSRVPAYPSICLGVFDASLYDMVGAYSVFVNRGIWTEPTYLLKIEDKNGAILWEHKQNIKQALDQQTAYVMTDMLKAVVNEGTGVRLRFRYNLTNPIGGKTGTTQDNSDGWFIGITPQLVTGVWTGFEDRQIHFASLDLGEGANSALPIFALYMKKVYADKGLHYSKGDFPPPPGGVSIPLDCSTYIQNPVSPQSELDQKLGF